MSLSKVDPPEVCFSKKELSEMYHSKKFSDVEFILGPKETFRAHRFLLAARSVVFHGKFFGPAEAQNKCVKTEPSALENLPNPTQEQKIYVITDVKPSAFENMLKYVYLSEIPEENELEILDLFNVAQTYAIKNLAENCLAQLMKMTWHAEHICLIYEAACKYNNVNLKSHCEMFLSNNTRDIFSSNGFLNTHLSTVSAIAKLKIADVESEMEFVEALLKWSKHRAQDLEIPIRHIFQVFLPFICMKNIDGLMWARLLEKYPSVFTEEEAVAVFMFICNPSFTGYPHWCRLSNTRMYTNDQV